MALIGGAVGRFLLARLGRTNGAGMIAHAYAGHSKLDVLLGSSFFERVVGRTVVDFGCGSGLESVELARRGALHVIGVDTHASALEQARARAAAAGVSHLCTFASAPDRPADIIVSLDSFEHFADPAAILRIMDDCLAPDGEVVVSFGPTWHHPYGGHMFSVVPWAHLLFTERALLEWRKSQRPGQTARTFRDCGLNGMTIRRFRDVVADSPFRFAEFEARPIRAMRVLSNRLTREFCTSVVRCRLVKKDAGRHGFSEPHAP